MAELALSSVILNKFRMMSAATAAPATAADGATSGVSITSNVIV
jgi:hypothetical protein